MSLRTTKNLLIISFILIALLSFFFTDSSEGLMIVFAILLSINMVFLIIISEEEITYNKKIHIIVSTIIFFICLFGAFINNNIIVVFTIGLSTILIYYFFKNFHIILYPQILLATTWIWFLILNYFNFNNLNRTSRNAALFSESIANTFIILTLSWIGCLITNFLILILILYKNENNELIKRFNNFINLSLKYISTIYSIFFVSVIFIKSYGIKEYYEAGTKMYNLVLFKTINNYLAPGNFNINIAVSNVIGNILIFVPFGFFACVLCKSKFNSLVKTILLFISFSFAIEIVQLVFQIGLFDVDDILLNVIGSTIGYLLYLVYKQINKKVFGNELQISKVND